MFLPIGSFVKSMSTRPAKAETVGTDEGWAHAEKALEQALEAIGLDYVVDEGEGAFYGPKIDVQVTDAIGRAFPIGEDVAWTCPDGSTFKHIPAGNRSDGRPGCRACSSTFNCIIFCACGKTDCSRSTTLRSSSSAKYNRTE